MRIEIAACSVVYNFVDYNRHNYNTEWIKCLTHICIKFAARKPCM